MATLFMINLTVMLWGVTNGETPHLLGGGCLMENQKLIMSGSFVPGSEPELSKESYRLDLTYKVTVPSNDTVEWSPVLPSNKLPGDLLPYDVLGKTLLFYVLGDFFKPKDKELKRRSGADAANAISSTSFYTLMIKSFSKAKKAKQQEVKSAEVAPGEKSPIVVPPGEDSPEEDKPDERDSEEEDPVKVSPVTEETLRKKKSADYKQFKPTPKMVFFSAPNPSNSTSSEKVKPKFMQVNTEPNSNLDSSPKTETKTKAEPELTQAEMDKVVSRMYYGHLRDNLRIAIKKNDNLIYLENLSKPTPIGSSLSIVTLENVQTKALEYKTTTGDIPLNRAGFSAAQYRNYLYITGGQDPQQTSDGNFIYQLNLDSYVWSKFAPEGFRGTKSGCLYYSHPYLIHAFGMLDQTYPSTTQFVNTKTWSKVQTYDPNPEDPPAPIPIPSLTLLPSFSSSTTVITVSSIAGFLSILSLSSLAFLLIRRRRRARSQLTLPTIIATPVWSPMPQPQYQLDTTLISHDPNLFYDFKLAKSYSPSSLQLATGSTQVTGSPSSTSTATSHPQIA